MDIIFGRGVQKQLQLSLADVWVSEFLVDCCRGFNWYIFISVSSKLHHFVQLCLIILSCMIDHTLVNKMYKNAVILEWRKACDLFMHNQSNYVVMKVLDSFNLPWNIFGIVQPGVPNCSWRVFYRNLFLILVVTNMHVGKSVGVPVTKKFV